MLDGRYRGILNDEIFDLRHHMAQGWLPQKAAQECYEILSKPLYAPTTYPDLIDGFDYLGCDIVMAEVVGRESQLLEDLVIFKSALLLDLLLENANNSLGQLWERVQIQSGEETDRNASILDSMAILVSKLIGLGPMDLIRHKGVFFDHPNPYQRAMEFLRKVEFDLKKFRHDGTLPYASQAQPGGDPVVEQAFRRIVETISRQAEVTRRAGELAEKCQQLKAIFPDAQVQIDRLFRQEIDLLARQ